jgi:hypothetical protein
MTKQAPIFLADCDGHFLKKENREKVIGTDIKIIEEIKVGEGKYFSEEWRERYMKKSLAILINILRKINVPLILQSKL